MACTVCGTPIEPGNSFCVSCGAAVAPAAEPESLVSPSVATAPQPAPQAPRVPKKRGALVAVIIAALVLSAGGTALFQQWNENRLERLAQEDVVQAFGEGVLADAVTNCVAIRNVVEDVPEQAIAAYADSLAGLTDPRQALATSQTADFPASAHLPAYERGVSQEVVRDFVVLLSSDDRGDIAPPKQLERWEEEWSTFSLDHCGALIQYDDNVELLRDADAILDGIRELAADAPWYPEGFSEYSANLAYRWSTNEGGWPCNSCVFWKMTVVTKNGCTSGLYGEINVLRNGSTVDWTNDLVAYVAPGGSAVLTYTRYPYNSGLQGQLIELSCY